MAMFPGQPDYVGGGLVNLVQSIGRALGAAGSAARYPSCNLLSPAMLATARRIVLVVVDGLGRTALERLPEESALRRYRLGTLTSVFPSTTASAITTVMTGLAPAQHGLTGWHINLREIGQTLAILPMTPRVPNAALAFPADELMPALCPYPTLFQRLRCNSRVIVPQHVAGSPFNAWHTRGAEVRPYASLTEFFMRLGEEMHDTAPGRYLYAYYPELDSVAHRYGCDSPKAQTTLLAFARAFDEFLAAVAGSDAWLIVTADHGFIDSPPSRLVNLGEHRQIAACLAQPLSGERRAAYCHVRPEARAEFVECVTVDLGHCLQLVASRDLIDAGWFGPPPYHRELAARVGDYTVLPREDWTITDWLPGEKPYRLIGVHGGASRAEMEVPLIAVRV